MNDKTISFTGIGIPTVITVFLILILTVFSAMALFAAKADLVLAERNAQTVTAYYSGELNSQEAVIDDGFLPIYAGE